MIENDIAHRSRIYSLLLLFFRILYHCIFFFFFFARKIIHSFCEQYILTQYLFVYITFLPSNAKWILIDKKCFISEFMSLILNCVYKYTPAMSNQGITAYNTSRCRLVEAKFPATISKILLIHTPTHVQTS